MVMHGQNDILDQILCGRKNEDIVMDVFDQSIERDQQLDDFMDPYDDMSLLREFDLADQPVLNDVCTEEEVTTDYIEAPQEVQELIVVSNGSILQTAPVSQSHNQSENFFQFPEVQSDGELTTIDLQAFLNNIVDANDANQLTEDDSNSCATSLYSPSTTATSPTFSLPPQTPDTASSLGSSSGNMPSFVKEGLKHAIRSKRHREGKEEIKVEFVEPPPEKLTEEEELKRIEKREKNKYAAQKCREKKRARAETLEAETRKLQKEQSRFKTEIQKLLDEREHLMNIINVHSAACPKFRSISSSI